MRGVNTATRQGGISTVTRELSWLELLLGDRVLTEALDSADQVYNRINAAIDKHISDNSIEAPPGAVYEPVWAPAQERVTLSLAESGITSVIWCIGFSPDFRWLNAPVFTGRGHPVHERGVTSVPGLYFIGLPWLYTWGSGRLGGVARDAQFIADRIAHHREHCAEARLTASPAAEPSIA